LTALAGIIVAAIQASGVTTGFITACAWSLVILAAALEAIFHFFWQNARWPAWRKWATTISATVGALVIVGLLDWRAYQKEYLVDDLRVNFQTLHPFQVGTDKLSLNFLIAPKATAMLLEETVAIEVGSSDRSNDPLRNSDLCKLLAPFIISKSTQETWVHPGQKVLHHSMERPPHSLREANEDWGTLPSPDDGKLDLAIYEPKAILLNGKEFPVGPIAMEAGKPLAIAATFETDPAHWEVHNVTTICGAIRYLSADGRDTWAVCPAQVIAQMYREGKSAGTSFGPFATTPFAFGSNSNDNRCGTWASGK